MNEEKWEENGNDKEESLHYYRQGKKSQKKKERKKEVKKIKRRSKERSIILFSNTANIL